MLRRDSWKLLGTLSVVVALAAGTGRFASSQSPAAAEAESATPSSPAERDAGDRAVRRKLQSKVTADYHEFALDLVIADLARRADVRHWIDDDALEIEGIDADAPVTEAFSDVTIETALEMLLPQLDLDWYIEDGILKITSSSQAGEVFVTHSYAAGPLIRAIDEAIKKLPPPDELGYRHLPPEQRAALQAMNSYAFPFGPQGPETWLIDAIENETAGPWIDVEGVGGSIDSFENVFVIRQTRRNHDEIAALLAALAEAAAAEPGPRSFPVRPATYPAAADEAVRKGLERPVSAEYHELPLHAVLGAVFQQARVPFRIDREALRSARVEPDAPVSVRQTDVPLRVALRLILEPLGLCVVPSYGTALIRTEEAAAELRHTVVYDVRDLTPHGDATQLIDVIENQTSGPWLNINGVGGSITPLPNGLLVIRHSGSGHDEVAELLGDLRRQVVPAKSVPEGPPADPDSVETVVYHVVEPGDDPRQFVAAVKTYVAPESWETGEATLIGRALIVRHRKAIHRPLGTFIDELNAAAPRTPPAGGVRSKPILEGAVGRNRIPSARNE
ncbi:MAG: hypothetical protein WD066_09750 [Planctomycetaceae bacterium]